MGLLSCRPDLRIVPLAMNLALSQSKCGGGEEEELSEGEDGLRAVVHVVDSSHAEMRSERVASWGSLAVNALPALEMWMVSVGGLAGVLVSWSSAGRLAILNGMGGMDGDGGILQAKWSR